LYRKNAGRRFLINTAFQEYYQNCQDYQSIAQYEGMCEDDAFEMPKSK
jgi:hypothetical protein